MRRLFKPSLNVVLFLPFSLIFLYQAIQPALAEPPPIYDVEVVIFTHRNTSDYGERWPLLTRDGVITSGRFPAGEFTELARSLYRLDNVRAGLSRSSGYSVLFHRAWRQLAYDSAHAVGYPVHTIAEQGRNSVEGSIKLARDRFLHLDIDLWLMAAQARRTKIMYSDDPGSSPAFKLKEKRRIRSKTLYYFDHPRFGMVASVTPYRAPQTETQASQESTSSSASPAETPATVQRPVDDQLTR